MLRSILAGFAVVALGSLVLGCDSKDPNASDPGTPPPAKTDEPQKSASTEKHFDFKEPNVQKGDIAVIDTSLGIIKFEFLQDQAPKHAANFEKLAEAGFYDGTKFHRVIPHFMIQGGDPYSRGDNREMMGQGDPGWKVDAELSPTKFERGIVGMARGNDINSAGSQFFVMVDAYPSLNGKYTAFGKVTEGMDVADKIVNLKRDQRDNPLDPAIVKSITIVHPAQK